MLEWILNALKKEKEEEKFTYVLLLYARMLCAKRSMCVSVRVCVRVRKLRNNEVDICLNELVSISESKFPSSIFCVCSCCYTVRFFPFFILHFIVVFYTKIKIKGKNGTSWDCEVFFFCSFWFRSQFNAFSLLFVRFDSTDFKILLSDYMFINNCYSYFSLLPFHLFLSVSADMVVRLFSLTRSHLKESHCFIYLADKMKTGFNTIT